MDDLAKSQACELYWKTKLDKALYGFILAVNTGDATIINHEQDDAHSALSNYLQAVSTSLAIAKAKSNGVDKV